MSCRRSRSRSGCSRTRASSSPTSSACRPTARSASMRCLEGREPQLLQTGDVRLGERLVGEVGQRVAAQEREGVREHLCGVRGGGRARGREEIAEAGEVELVGTDAEDVSGRARREAVGAQVLAQPRDVHLDGLRRRRRRIVAPQRGLDPVERHRLVRVQQEEREDRALLRASQCDRAAALGDLQRPEESEVHGVRSSATVQMPVRCYHDRGCSVTASADAPSRPSRTQAAQGLRRVEQCAGGRSAS